MALKPLVRSPFATAHGARRKTAIAKNRVIWQAGTGNARAFELSKRTGTESE